jgi:hypothetical protein
MNIRGQRQHHLTEDVRQMVRNELADVLKSPHFVTSKRYPSFLVYVVEKTLEGKSDELKERTIGIEVFERKSDYDTNNDTSVRVVAGEVRKRLALFYSESKAEHRVQISLPAGSYSPEFSLLASPEVPASTDIEEQPAQLNAYKGNATSSPGTRRIGFWWIVVALIAFLALPAARYWSVWGVGNPASIDRFWHPVQSASAPTLICAGALDISPIEHTGVTEADQQTNYPYVSMMTARVLISLTDLFAENHTKYLVQPVSSISLADMREQPVVLIGAYDNKWTVLLLNDKRFRFSAKPAAQIEDEFNPAVTWSRQNSRPYDNQDDYAVVARFHDKLTDSLVVVIAGIGKNGTEAAAQFVTSPHYLDLLDQYAKGWTSKNIEVVLKTTVVDGKTGAPSIEAVHVW